MPLAVASKAACIFSLIISLASRRALPPPRISFLFRNAITRFASTANNIKELTIRPPSTQPRRTSGNGSGFKDGCTNLPFDKLRRLHESGERCSRHRSPGMNRKPLQRRRSRYFRFLNWNQCSLCHLKPAHPRAGTPCFTRLQSSWRLLDWPPLLWSLWLCGSRWFRVGEDDGHGQVKAASE
jgi:hypothetical protein